MAVHFKTVPMAEIASTRGERAIRGMAAAHGFEPLEDGSGFSVPSEAVFGPLPSALTPDEMCPIRLEETGPDHLPHPASRVHLVPVEWANFTTMVYKTRTEAACGMQCESMTMTAEQHDRQRKNVGLTCESCIDVLRAHEMRDMPARDCAGCDKREPHADGDYLCIYCRRLDTVRLA